MLADHDDGGGDGGGTRLRGTGAGMNERDLPTVSQRRKDLVMSVATQLGLADPEGDLLGQAREMWPTWCAHNPCLNVVDDLLDLPSWLRAADPEAGDSVM